MGRDAVPVILDAVRHVEAWADQQETGSGSIEPPRAVGRYETQLRGTALERIAQPYSLWMLERCLSEYRGLASGERAQVDAAVAGTGWEPLLAYEPRHRAHKRGFTLLID